MQSYVNILQYDSSLFVCNSRLLFCINSTLWDEVPIFLILVKTKVRTWLTWDMLQHQHVWSNIINSQSSQLFKRENVKTHPYLFHHMNLSNNAISFVTESQVINKTGNLNPQVMNQLNIFVCMFARVDYALQFLRQTVISV